MAKTKRYWFLIRFFNKMLLCVWIGGCASSSYDAVASINGISVRNQSDSVSIEQKITELRSAVKKKSYKRQELKIYKNKYVKKWIRYFSKKDRKRFKAFLSRGHYYKELIQTILEEEEISHLLYYLPLIESGFNTKAHSRAGAVGPWQFVKATGKRYGLDVNSYVDERRDAILSTEAAAKYLGDLYNVFHSWELAIAAYNCGEMRVLRAIMRGKTRDFWVLSRKKLLPKETRNYVPKFLAAAYIGENLKKYKIKVRTSGRFPDVAMYKIPGGIKLKKIASMLGYSYTRLKKINPSLKKHRSPPWLKSHSIWLPPVLEGKIKKIARKLYARKKKRVRRYADVYRVKRGDSLSRISKKFKISLRKIKRINSIKGSYIYPGQRLLLNTRAYKRVLGKRFYFVRRTDYLGRIARRFGVSIKYLKRLNGLSSNRIYIGQKLDVSSNVKVFRYVVRKGDHLVKIAQLYGTTIKSIRRKNSLRSSRIYVGQILMI